MLAKKIISYKLPVLSALLIAFSYVPFYPFASLFAFIPLWVFILQAKELKKVFYGSLISSSLLAMISSYWIFIAIKTFGSMSIIFAVFLSLLFFMISQLFIPLAAVCSFIIKKYFKLNTVFTLLVFAILFSLFQEFSPSPLPWYSSTAFLQYQIPFYHFADIFGFSGLNTILLLFNASFAYAYLYKKKLWALSSLLSFLFITALGYFYGQSYNDKNLEQKNVSVKIVQSGIGNNYDYRKYYPNSKLSFSKKVLDIYIKETVKGKKAMINLWSESALLNYANQENFLSKRLKLFAKKNKQSIIYGSWFFNYKHQLPQIALFFYSGVKKSQILPYKKVKLVAFGESLPLKKYFPTSINWLHKKLPLVGNFLAAKTVQVKKFEQINFGSQICYESMFPSLTRDLSKKSAQILLNVSNDSWYDSWFQPKQHLYTSFSRAIEARLPMIRASSTGISGAILANGTVLKLSNYNKGKPWSHLYNILYSKKNKLSFYTKYPYLMPYFLFILLLSILFFSFLFFSFLPAVNKKHDK